MHTAHFGDWTNVLLSAESIGRVALSKEIPQ